MRNRVPLNTALGGNVVLDCFLDGVSEYGMPARIRTDRGRENVDIWQYMVDIWGEKTTPILLEVVYTIVE